MSSRPRNEQRCRSRGDSGRLPACAALLTTLGLMVGCAEDGRDPPRVTIRGQVWRVEIAATQQRRYRGLSGRSSLAPDAGMLFVYPEAQAMAYCMRDCLIPIDIAFIGSDRRVVATYTMQVEPDLAGRVSYASPEPAQFVLEVQAGALERAGVRVGDVVTLAGDIPEPAKVDPDR